MKFMDNSPRDGTERFVHCLKVQNHFFTTIMWQRFKTKLSDVAVNFQSKIVPHCGWFVSDEEHHFGTSCATPTKTIKNTNLHTTNSRYLHARERRHTHTPIIYIQNISVSRKCLSTNISAIAKMIWVICLLASFHIAHEGLPLARWLE